MPTNLPVRGATVRRSVARQPGESFLYPLLVLVILACVAMVSILRPPVSDRASEIPVSTSSFLGLVSGFGATSLAPNRAQPDLGRTFAGREVRDRP